MTTTTEGTRTAVKAGVCCLMLTCGVTGIAMAGQQPLPFVMTVISDQAQGERMLAGDYATAIREIGSSKGGAVGFAALNNLCVALAKTGELEAALEACNAAVETARPAASVSYYERGRRYESRAVALANRGVVRAVRGDAEGARRDFLEAARTGAAFDAPAVNLGLLDGGNVAPASAAGR
jgi:tetratricopeptide (TPR) repeat protein